MNFNEKLMGLRKSKGWSQEDLGNELGVSRQTVSKWENGQTTPEMTKLIEIARIFEMSLDELLENKDNNFKKEIEIKYSSLKYHYEYKSKKEVFGIPLLHINIGRGIYKSKGIISIGNIACGILSIGLLSIGILSFGVFCLSLLAFGAISIGLCSVGALALGGIAVGGCAFGILSIGGLAVGVYSIGGCAIAHKIALGGYASGHIAIGDKAKGVITFIIENNSLNGTSTEVRNAILKDFPNTFKWIVNLFTLFI